MVAHGLPLCESLGSTTELETHSPPEDGPQSSTALWHQNLTSNLQIWGGCFQNYTQVCVLKRLTGLIESCYFHSDGLLQGVRSAKGRNAYVRVQECSKCEASIITILAIMLLSWQWCVTMCMENCQPGKLIQASVFVLRLHYMGMIDWYPHVWSQFLDCSPSTWTPKLLP